MKAAVTSPLVGREKETKYLAKILKSQKAEFIAVFGRRRIGKTFLIKSFFRKQPCLFFHITGSRKASMKELIDDFTRILEKTFYQDELTLENPKNWKRCFELLTSAINREAKNKKVILFFDELPWLAGKRSRFVAALDYYWNRFWSDNPNIKVIVCGSAASWMIDNIINDEGGLHNRMTGQIAMQPFNLRETKAFFVSRKMKYSDAQTLEAYMTTGGVAYYLELFEKGLSVTQNIDRLCFQSQGELVKEFKRLFKSLFSGSDRYMDIVRALAKKRKGLERTEMLSQLKNFSDGGSINKRLEALEHSGFIVEFVPYGHKKRGKFYRLIDEYSLFYLKWIVPTLSSVRKLDRSSGYWLEKTQTASWKSWAGYAFESVCYKHIAQLRKALQIPVSAEVGSWQYIPKKGSKDEGAQIDLLFDRHDGAITIIEIKFRNVPYTLNKEEYRALMKKIEIFKQRTKIQKKINVVLITNQPIKSNLYSEEFVDFNVTLVDLLRDV